MPAGAVVALAPAVASADAPWSAPVDIGPSVARTAAPALDFVGAGIPLLGWRVLAAEPPAGRPATTDRAILATIRPGGEVVRATLRDDLVAQAPCGPGCVALLRQRDPGRRGGRSLLRVCIGSGPGNLGRPRTLARYAAPEEFGELAVGTTKPAIAAHPGGGVAVAWVQAQRVRQDGSTRGFRLRLAMRARGGAFGPARTIAQAGAGGALRHARLAFHGRDAVTVAYVRERRGSTRGRRVVEARLVRRRGRMSAAQVLGPAPESFTDLRIAAAPGRRSAIAWGNVHGTVLGFQDRWVIRAAIRPASARRFGPARVLDPGAVADAGAPGEVGAGIASDGTATVAWSASVPALPINETVVRVATARPGRRFGRPQTITPRGINAVEDLAVSSRGAALLTWTAFIPGVPGVSIMAAVRPAGTSAFGVPEIVTTLRPGVLGAVDPAPATDIDEATGLAAVAWAGERTVGEPPLHVPLSAVLRLARRSKIV